MTDSIPWFGPEVGQPEKDAVTRVLDSGYINDGKVTRELERAIAARIGVRHCVAVTSGTTALTLALIAIGVGAGDEVIVPDLTFAATANAVVLAGASVRLVDIEPARFGIDPERVRAAIGPHTRAVMPVDVNGRGCNYEALASICKEHGIALVCDAAEGFGSSYRGKFLGAFGDAGAFSFSPNKTVTTGQGGVVVTNRDDIYHRLLELKDQGRREGGTGGNDLHPVIGFNFKLTNVQAAIGLAQLDRADQRLSHFRSRDAWYREALANVQGITFPPSSEPGEYLQWTDVLCERRDAIEGALVRNGIGNRPFWLPLHRQRPYAASDSGFPNAIRVSDHGLWLPSHFSVTREQVLRTSAVIRDALQE